MHIPGKKKSGLKIFIFLRGSRAGEMMITNKASENQRDTKNSPEASYVAKRKKLRGCSPLINVLLIHD